MSSGKTIVITGASDGIGAAAARRLHVDGHTVVVVGRSPDKTRAVASELDAPFHVADFTRLEDIVRLAGELSSAYDRIDVLANNAGGVFGDYTVTVDGFEKTFQINHLAPFLLTRLLMETLIASRASVLQTSSYVRLTKQVDLDNLNHEGIYNPVRAYAAAKLENILFTTELDRRYRPAGIATACFYPGNVATSFGSGSTSRLMKLITGTKIGRSLLDSPEQGADQLVWLAEGTPGTDWQYGAYYYKRKVTVPPNSQATDANFARQFWDRSEQLLANHLAGTAG